MTGSKLYTQVSSTTPNISLYDNQTVSSPLSHGMQWDSQLYAFVALVISFTVVVFLVATIQWLRTYKDTPAAKKKAAIRKNKKLKALEEKRIGQVSMNSVSCETFLSSYKKKLKDQFLPIEFKALGRSSEEYPQLIASLPCNFQKNNSRNVLPYDHSRVCLDTPPTMVDNDYINANFIFKMQSAKRVKAYIAAQGPLPNTVADFWKMVWQEGVNTIVMLTNVFSYSKQECEKYWHNTYSMYGDIHVYQESVSITCHYTIRHFSISKVGFQKSRQIAHFQFHTWTEQEVPECPAVLEFRRKIRWWQSSSGVQSPLLVHCGDGAGRTGAFITLDIVLDNLREKGTIDILSTILNIRKFRPSLVDHLSQLHLIYKCVASLLTCGATVVKVGELNSLVQQMAKRDNRTRMSGFEKEFKTLREITPRLTIGECAGGHRVENRRKSRDIMIQPPERARPYLMTFDSSDSSDFVNAVYVNGYNFSNEFVVSQWPLKNTCKDFWRLIFDAHISSVVVLHDCTPSRNFPEFWPKKVGVKEKFGPVCSTLISTEHTPSLVVKTFHIKKVYYNDIIQSQGCSIYEKEKILFRNITQHIHAMGQMTCIERHLRPDGQALINPADISSFGAESRPVQIAFLKNWPDSQKVPLQNYALLDLIETSIAWKDSQTATNTPTLVISKNGVSRAGIYCASSICTNKLNNEGEVDVFNAARTVMQNRPQLIENLIEYTYLYTMMNGLAETVPMEELDMEPALTPLMVNVYNHNYSSSETTKVPTTYSLNASSTARLTDRAGSSMGLSHSHPSFGKVSHTTSSQISGLPSVRTSMLPSDISQSASVPTHNTSNGHCGNSTAESLTRKFTDGKGFLHYNQPIQQSDIVDEPLGNEDNISTTSSFRMDSDILSLENAEFVLQSSYNNHYIQQLANNEKFYAANSVLKS